MHGASCEESEASGEVIVLSDANDRKFSGALSRAGRGRP